MVVVMEMVMKSRIRFCTWCKVLNTALNMMCMCSTVLPNVFLRGASVLEEHSRRQSLYLLWGDDQ